MKHPLSYTVLRYIHEVLTREFVNVGVVLCSREGQFARARCAQSLSRVKALFPKVNIEDLQDSLAFIEEQTGNPRSLQPVFPENARILAERVLPQDDSSLQWSAMGGGISDDLQTTLDQIYQRMVAPNHL